MIKVNRINWYHVPPSIMHRKHISLTLLPQMQTLGLIVKKKKEKADQPQLRETLQNNWLIFFKSVTVMKECKAQGPQTKRD